MKNIVKMVFAVTLLIATCSLFAHNGDFNKRDARRSQNNCPRQHRDGGDGNQNYSGEQYPGEKYQGEDYQGEFDNSNCQNRNSNCNYKSDSDCSQKQDCRSNKGCGMKKRDGKGPHQNKQDAANQK